MSARADAKDKIEGLQEGADDYVTKPFDIQELVARVDNLITSRRSWLNRLSVKTWLIVRRFGRVHVTLWRR